MGDIFVLAESHPENLINSATENDKVAQSSLNGLISKYGSETARKCILEAIVEPNWMGLNGADGEIVREIAHLVGKSANCKVDSEKIAPREMNVIGEVNPSVFYLEGRGGNAPHIERVIEGKKVIYLDEGCTWYGTVLEMIDKDTVENNPFYGEVQRNREIYWTERIAGNLPVDGGTGLIKVGHNHLKPNEEGFGYLLEFLRKGGIEPQVIYATIDESKYAEKEGLPPNPMGMYF